MVDQVKMYALTGEPVWIDFPNPGFHRQANGSFDPVVQRDAKAIFNAAIMVYTSQQNVKGALNGALNKAVAKAYRHNHNVIWVREFLPHNAVWPKTYGGDKRAGQDVAQGLESQRTHRGAH